MSDKATNFILVGVALALLSLHPAIGGRVTRAVTQYQAERRLVRTWDTLLAASSPWIDADGDRPTLVVFSDYECPYCRALHPELAALAAEGQVQVRILHFPLSIHPKAFPAAQAAHCAHEQAAFPRFHELLFDDPAWREGEGPQWGAMADAAGVGDPVAFETCIGGPDARIAVAEQQQIALDLGVATGDVVHEFGEA